MDYMVYDFVTSLKEFQTCDETWTAVSRFFKPKGFMMVSHGYLPPSKTPPGQCCPFVQNVDSPIRVDCSETVAEFYYKNAYQYDPIFYKPKPGLGSFLTGPDLTTRAQFGDDYFSFMEEVREQGFRSGFVVPLVDVVTGNMGRFMIGSSLGGVEAKSLLGEQGEIYQLIMLLADEYLKLLPFQREISALNISKREVECLLWLANGDRVDRIADRLHIANATVNLHFANLKRKLSASTREQALVKALRFGIINP